MRRGARGRGGVLPLAEGPGDTAANKSDKSRGEADTSNSDLVRTRRRFGVVGAWGEPYDTLRCILGDAGFCSRSPFS